MQSAMELFVERGFEQTTAAEVAARAGVTERTYFRYFADKREVLFVTSDDLQNRVSEGIAGASPESPPFKAVLAALEGVASMIAENPDYSRQRAAVIAANPSLQERELLKLQTVAAVAAEALRMRGVRELSATLAAEFGVTVFRVGYDLWIAGGATGDFTGCMHQALDELRAQVGVRYIV